MPNIDENLLESATALRDVMLSLGLDDRVMEINNIVSRASRNVEAEKRMGAEKVERVERSIGNVIRRLEGALSQRRVCNSDVLAIVEDSREDISNMLEDGPICPDFISIPSFILTSGVSRVMRRMSGKGPSDRLGFDSMCILHRAIRGAYRYDDEG